MAVDDYLVDAQHVHAVVQYGHQVRVRVHHWVGDVAVDEHVAGLGGGEMVRWYAVVAATDSQEEGMLLLGQLSEQFGVFLLHARAPCTVAVQYLAVQVGMAVQGPAVGMGSNGHVRHVQRVVGVIERVAVRITWWKMT
jgi:hypothetical protein